MSNNEILDPRLRDTALTAFSHQNQSISSGTTLQTPIAPNPSTSRSPIVPSPQQYVGSPHQAFFPQTPQSTGNLTDNDGGDSHRDGGAHDPKRSRACEACRGLKVRCEPGTNGPDGPCRRCAKANRHCVVTVPSRKRQKKTDSRVAELEKKIDALTASLHAKHGSSSIGQTVETSISSGMNGADSARHNPYQQVTNGGYGSPYVSRPDGRGDEWAGYSKGADFDSRRSSVPPMVVAGQKRKNNENRDYADSPSSAASLSKKAQEAAGFLAENASKFPQSHEYADIVDKGILTAEMAAQMFDCYVEKMAPHFPAVVFPPGTTAAEIRKTKPILFLAILSASAGSTYPELQKTLTKEVMTIYADRIIMNGEKTLELIQALHINTLWYWPPEHFEELKFYQLIHISAVMAIDIGMGKKNKSPKSKAAGLWRDHPWRRTPYPDPESVEARRAWLSCYFLCCNASMGLRRPNLIRWSSFMADCVDFLENSPDAAPSDKSLCQWVRSQHIAEEIGTQFSMDDPSAKISIADPKVQYALKGFEHDLAVWSNQLTPESSSPCLRVTEHVVNLYMHEVAMHVDHNVEEFKPPFTEDALRGVEGASPHASLTPEQIRALSICLESIDGIFDEFLKFDVDTVRCLPVANFVRVAYAVVVLIKMYFAAVTPNSDLGKIFDKDNMKVEYYLDGLVALFKASASEEKSRPAAKFLMVLVMLKTWFHRQREPKPTETNDSSGGRSLDTPSETPSDANQAASGQQRPQASYSPANTPLQLLSEVATGNSGGQAHNGSVSNYPSDWPQAPPLAYAGYNLNGFPLAQQYGGVSGNLDPALGMDMNYSLGDGLEQAMGMTLGAGDFGNYFSDDNFFSGIIDSVGQSSGFEGFAGQ